MKIPVKIFQFKFNRCKYLISKGNFYEKIPHNSKSVDLDWVCLKKNKAKKQEGMWVLLIWKSNSRIELGHVVISESVVKRIALSFSFPILFICISIQACICNWEGFSSVNCMCLLGLAKRRVEDILGSSTFVLAGRESHHFGSILFEHLSFLLFSHCSYYHSSLNLPFYN